MNELLWDQRWTRAQVHLHSHVQRINQNLAENCADCVIALYLVDAVNLDALDRLAHQYSHVYVLSEHEIENRWPNVSVHSLPQEFYGCYWLDDLDTNVAIDKQFNCFINRIDPIRQSWFYFLYQRGWLDQGFVSFNMRAASHLRSLDEPDTSESLAAGYREFVHNHKTMLSSFDDIFDSLRSIVPYKNFKENLDLCSLILRSKFSLILETYFDRPDCRVLSEKTWRALQLPRPWLLFAATGCVQKLRDMGFDVFDQYVDHDYDMFDTSDSCVARQEAMLEQFERLMHFNVTTDVLQDWNNIATYNRGILSRWSRDWKYQCDQAIQLVANSALGAA